MKNIEGKQSKISKKFCLPSRLHRDNYYVSPFGDVNAAYTKHSKVKLLKLYVGIFKTTVATACCKYDLM